VEFEPYHHRDVCAVVLPSNVLSISTDTCCLVISRMQHEMDNFVWGASRGPSALADIPVYVVLHFNRTFKMQHGKIIIQ